MSIPEPRLWRVTFPDGMDRADFSRGLGLVRSSGDYDRTGKAWYLAVMDFRGLQDLGTLRALGAVVTDAGPLTARDSQ